MSVVPATTLTLGRGDRKGAGAQCPPCADHHWWYLSIAKGDKAVHPMGHAMSHSVQSAFSCPPGGIAPIAGSVNWPRRCPGFADPLWSLAEGVGNVRLATASMRLPPSFDFRGVTRPPWLPSVEVGVGQSFTAAGSAIWCPAA